MNNYKRLFIMLAILLAMANQIHAQEIDYDALVKAECWYSDRCEEAVLGFESARQNPNKHPQKYCVFPHQHAGSLGHALVISTTDESEMVLFTPNGSHLQRQRISKSILPKEIYWNNISNLGRSITISSDITLRERPIPIRTPNKKDNSFSAVVETNEHLTDIGSYNQMIFKPHHNAVRLSSKYQDKKVNPDGSIIKDEMEYVFKLTNPSVIAKMFRGYEDEEMCPWVVKNSFFNHHSILQYSRWKDGEPVKKASKDACRIISDYYGGRAIKDTRWLATLESGERSFYAVQFEISGTEALGAMVCIAEGEVASTWEFQGKIDPATYQEGESIWFVDDGGNFMDHAPEIHCIAATDKGLELYVRLYGGESVQYFILREMGSVLMEIQADYWVYVWD